MYTELALRLNAPKIDSGRARGRRWLLEDDEDVVRERMVGCAGGDGGRGGGRRLDLFDGGDGGERVLELVRRGGGGEGVLDGRDLEQGSGALVREGEDVVVK